MNGKSVSSCIKIIRLINLSYLKVGNRNIVSKTEIIKYDITSINLIPVGFVDLGEQIRLRGAFT